MAMLFVEIIGWIGVFMILLAYALLTTKKLKSTSFIYHGLNLSGSLLIAVNAFSNHAYPSVTANVMFMAIAVYGCTRINSHKNYFL